MVTIRVTQLASLGWGAWSILVMVSVALLLVVGRIEGWLRPDPVAAPLVRQEPAPSTLSAYLLSALRTLTMFMAVLAAWLLPPFQIVHPLLALDLGLVCALAIAVLAIAPQLHRSVQRLRWRARAHTLAEIVATISVLLFILSVPAPWLFQRRLILANLVFCAGLTIYREIRRRWRTGDRSRASQIGGGLVVAQFLSLISVVAVLPSLALLVLQRLRIVHRVDPLTDAIGLFALLLTVISLIYGWFYLLRRIMRARGFSWVDPPNWRTFWPDLKYKIALNRLPRWPFLDVTLAGDLANTVRKAYVKGMLGGVATVDSSAQIAPPLRTPFAFTFAIIGDPGEGDDSQLYPLRPERWEKKEAIRKALQGGAQTDDSPDFVEALLSLADFAIISSDVVYPAGELMDFERGVYRPYNGLNIPIYAIPGNHDWYDDLQGFLVNFTYAAAHEPGTPLERELVQMPWSATFSPNRRWEQIDWLRRRYQLESLGGLPGRPETQQRLSFFELVFEAAPLTVLGLDNGVIGSIDDLQYSWLERRLRRAREAGHLIIVIAGMPLYVDAHFAGEKQPQPEVRGRISYGMREIYELLRRYNVDVVMGGDTHAYQRYQVRYTGEDGKAYTMHHFVNGGGGAYLSRPVDLTWPVVWSGERKLRSGAVYQALGQDEQGQPLAIYDDVSMIDLFPSGEQMLKKFSDPKTYAVDPAHAGWLARQRSAFQKWYTGVALARGITNALDHDQPPLLQSYMTVQMRRDPTDYSRWMLVLVPWFSAEDDPQPEPQYHKKLVLRVAKP
jgi:hypothetical protein